MKRSFQWAYSTYAWDVVIVADGLLQEPVADLPRENGRTFSLELRDLVHDVTRRYTGLRSANRSRSNRSRLVVPII